MNYPLYVAIILLAGLIGGKAASKVKLPSVTGYILFGLLLGPSITNVVTKEMIYSLQFVNHLALGILSISIGAELHRAQLRKFGKRLFLVSLGYQIFTASLVSIITYLLGIPFYLSIVLGLLAMTVSPSGVLSIFKEYQPRGLFSKTVLALVAIDNLICIVFFGIITALLQGIANTDITGINLTLNLAKEMGLAIGLGVISGIIIALVIKNKSNSNRFLVFVLGIILLNVGIANHYNLSSLLVNMVCGAAAVNLSNKKQLLYSTLERVEIPILVVFLTLAGAKLDLSTVAGVGIAGIGYVLARLVGKIIGSFFATKFISTSTSIRKNIGLALTPQAGVAIGLSIIAEQKFPNADGLISAIVLAGVVFFEVIGPLLVKKSLKNTGEIS